MGRMYNDGTYILKNTMAVPQDIKNGITIQPSKSTSGHMKIF